MINGVFKHEIDFGSTKQFEESRYHHSILELGFILSFQKVYLPHPNDTLQILSFAFTHSIAFTPALSSWSSDSAAACKDRLLRTFIGPDALYQISTLRKLKLFVVFVEAFKFLFKWLRWLFHQIVFLFQPLWSITQVDCIWGFNHNLHIEVFFNVLLWLFADFLKTIYSRFDESNLKVL